MSRQDRQSISISGCVQKVRFRNNSNQYTVLDVKTEEVGCSQTVVTVCGYMPGLTDGDQVTIDGRWVRHPKYGLQIEAERYQRVLPSSSGGIEAYLSSAIPGVGPKTAAKLVAMFKEDTLTVIQQDPDQLAAVKGISIRRAREIGQAVLKQRESERVLLYLFEYGITPGIAARVYKHYGQETIAVIQDDPYRLTEEVFGIGFVTADTIARKTGLPFHSPQRLQASIRHVLSEAAFSEGHTFLPLESVVERARALVNRRMSENMDDVEPVSADELSDAVQSMSKSGRIIVDGDAVYLMSLWKAEDSLAGRLGAMVNVKKDSVIEHELDEAIDWVERDLGVEYASGQRQAIKLAVNSGVSIITGGPGTGKTTVVKGLLGVWRRLKGEIKTQLACPTGRAAKRLAEATGRPATTIHRLLGWKPGAAGVWLFERNEEQPLTGELLIVDEVSMIDVLLAWHLIQAVSIDMRVVLVGDADQLPSVGPGNVLRDLIESGVVPTATLSTIFRQGERSGIVVSAHNVCAGNPIDRCYWHYGDGLPESDFAYVRRDVPDSAAKLTVEYAIEFASTGRSVQVLAPMYKGICGVDALNSLLQDALNPVRPDGVELKVGSRSYRLGDRVMQIRNNYEKEVFNGDVGHIIDIGRSDDGRGTEVTVEFDGFPVSYVNDDIDELVLAYAMTIHKSQGSEFESVVILLTRQHHMMLRRNLLYTAVSRAKEHLVLIGDARAVHMAIANNEVVRRHTRLGDRVLSAITAQDQA